MAATYVVRKEWETIEASKLGEVVRFKHPTIECNRVVGGKKCALQQTLLSTTPRHRELVGPLKVFHNPYQEELWVVKLT